MSGFPGLSHDPNPREIAERVNRLNQGKFNAVTTVTLEAGETSTTLTDKRIGGNTYIGFMPLTANAAAALATTHVSARDNGVATITHDNTADTDRTFDLVLIG